jgi:hypothetical protein
MRRDDAAYLKRTINPCPDCDEDRFAPRVRETSPALGSISLTASSTRAARLQVDTYV